MTSDKELNDVLDDVSPVGLPPVRTAAKAAAPRKPQVKKATPPPDPEEYEMHENPEVDVDLNTKTRPDPKADWVKIVIDEVEGLANYEVVGLNGKVFQIKRGTPTLVPPGVISVLEDCIATKTAQSRNPVTGAVSTTYHDYCPIPWRTVR